MLHVVYVVGGGINKGRSAELLMLGGIVPVKDTGLVATTNYCDEVMTAIIAIIVHSR